jgi:AcrR family transcriptional regulator
MSEIAPVYSTRQRTRKAPEERRKDILDAAERVLAMKGIAGTTVEDITAAAGVAKGTFYLYFQSKDQVVAALRDRFVEESLAHANELLSRVGQEDWWALVDTTIAAVIDFHLERQDTVRIFWGQGVTPETQDVLAACEARLVEMFAWGIRAGVDAGTFSTSDPEATARMLFHAIDGLLVHATLSGQPDRERLVSAATELCRKALTP